LFSWKEKNGMFGRKSVVTTKVPEEGAGDGGVRYSVADENGLERTETDGNGRPYYDIPFADSVDAVMNNDISGDG
jgi:hypothetical protein